MHLHNTCGATDLTQKIKNKEIELDNLLEGEEVWWKQRARTDWLQYGDKNTKFFHQKASQRRKKNRINEIMDSQGQKYTEHEDIERVLIEHFKDLFQNQATLHIQETVKVVEDRINADMQDFLQAEFKEEEVFHAIKDMKCLAAPGPDGLPALFFHTYWDIVGKDVTKEVLNILNHKGDPSPFNHTHICLIPKKTNPTSASDYRPISLCNVILKIVTKTLANRLKTILPDIISPNQSAFLKGRLITDNTLIAHEIFHFFSHSNNKKGFVGIKTDMAKAYDRVEWDFLRATLESMGFPQNMIDTIMRCVTSVTFSILINGVPSQSFYPKRGLRQGDPLSPYLFILCADVFSGLITKAHNSRLIKGIKIAHKAPEITHLFFADDSLLFCRANSGDIEHINNIITTYQNASGQLVNVNKSEIMFSKHVNNQTRNAIHQLLPMQRVDYFSKYLGVPTHIGRSRNQVFQFIQDRVWKKLKGWKEKNLSFAGRATLIKVVAQAIPTYLMSSFLFPKGLCDHMERQISNFWWGSNVDKRKIHWVNWRKTCKTKAKGGMGFRDLRAFNEALLAKQGWRLLTNPNSLVAKILKAKYYPNCDFLKAKHSQNMSFSWQSIQKASWILQKGCKWHIGNGESINIWEDRWIHTQFGSNTWSKKPENTPFKKVSDLIEIHNKCWKEPIVHQFSTPWKLDRFVIYPFPTLTRKTLLGGKELQMAFTL
jgi:hypothetical protein